MRVEQPPLEMNCNYQLSNINHKHLKCNDFNPRGRQNYKVLVQILNSIMNFSKNSNAGTTGFPAVC